jgi:hypothetical protein
LEDIKEEVCDQFPPIVLVDFTMQNNKCYFDPRVEKNYA